MGEALKDIYSKEFLNNFAAKVQSAYSIFDKNGFLGSVMDSSWEELTLKARIRKISKTLGEYLPVSYEEALEILFSIDESCVGFPYLFFPDFVEVYGQADENWELSINALERFTEKSSSEFAVRSFIMKDTKRMMLKMLEWSKSSNEHVRRLSSEGCRPRLPWGEALPMFKKDPTLVQLVLEALKDDASLYVRKSVANNLNDISKDNPSIILYTIIAWSGVSDNTDWILRRGSRSLIRKAHPEVMKLFGYEETTADSLVKDVCLYINPNILKMGDSCELSYELNFREGESMHIRIEYGIYFVKARGNTSLKKFFLCDKTVQGGEKIIGTKAHSWQELTTRKHYPGEHKIVLLVNGLEVADTLINLEL
jgi:3-methyladenine DNA glycosylase AlkC